MKGENGTSRFVFRTGDDVTRVDGLVIGRVLQTDIAHPQAVPLQPESAAPKRNIAQMNGALGAVILDFNLYRCGRTAIRHPQVHDLRGLIDKIFSWRIQGSENTREKVQVVGPFVEVGAGASDHALLAHRGCLVVVEHGAASGVADDPPRPREESKADVEGGEGTREVNAAGCEGLVDDDALPQSRAAGAVVGLAFLAIRGGPRGQRERAAVGRRGPAVRQVGVRPASLGNPRLSRPCLLYVNIAQRRRQRGLVDMAPVLRPRARNGHSATKHGPGCAGDLDRRRRASGHGDVLAVNARQQVATRCARGSAGAQLGATRSHLLHGGRSG